MNQPEYCFLWIDWWFTCMQKSEWASWVQAIGAIAAILFSVWLANKQAAKQHANALKEIDRQHALERQAGLAAVEIITAGCIGVTTGLVERLRDTAHPESTKSRVAHSSAELKAHLDALSAIPPSEMPAGAVVFALALSLCTRTIMWMVGRWVDAPEEKREALRQYLLQALPEELTTLREIGTGLRTGEVPLESLKERALTKGINLHA